MNKQDSKGFKAFLTYLFGQFHWTSPPWMQRFKTAARQKAGTTLSA